MTNDQPANPNSVHFSVEHPDGTTTDYGLRPANPPFGVETDFDTTISSYVPESSATIIALKVEIEELRASKEAGDRELQLSRAAANIRLADRDKRIAELERALRQSYTALGSLRDFRTSDLEAIIRAALAAPLSTHADVRRYPEARAISDEEIIAIRDEHLPSQGEAFDCIAFAHALLTAVVNPDPRVAPLSTHEGEK